MSRGFSGGQMPMQEIAIESVYSGQQKIDDNGKL